MKLYVIRHGRTDNNDQGLFNGRYDEDINETGIHQAELAREELDKYDIDLIICSPMKRTRHTAEIINTKNIPIIYDERLMERDTGSLTLQPVESVDRDRYWNYYCDKYEDVEPIKEVCKRSYAVLDEIKEKYSDKNVLIVTHNGVARTIYTYFNGVPEDGNMLSVGSHKNCEVKEYDLL